MEPVRFRFGRLVWGLALVLPACGNPFANGSSTGGKFAPNAPQSSGITLEGEVTGTAGATVVSKAVSENTAGAIVRRDSSGNFSAGTITGNLSGHATSATSFTGSLSGEVTGTQGATVISGAVATNTAGAIVRRDASGDFTARNITATNFVGYLVGNISGSAATFTDSLAGDISGFQKSATVVSVGGVTAANVASGAQLANAATSSNTGNAIVRRDASGDFSARQITATLIGNATGFTGSLAGDVTGTQGLTVISNLAVSKLAPGSDGQVLVTSTGVVGWSNSVSQADFALGKQGGSLASAATVTFGNDGNFFTITGTTDIHHFAARTAGNRVAVTFAAPSSMLLKHNSAVGSGPRLLLVGSGDYRPAAGDVFEFLYNGSDWQEIRRVVSGESRVRATLDTTGAQAIGTTFSDLVYHNELEDTQSEFDPTTGVFTARQGGTFQVTAQVTLDGPWLGGDTCRLTLVRDASTTPTSLFTTDQAASTDYCVALVTGSVTLTAGQTLTAAALVSSGIHTTTNGTNSARSYLTIVKVR